MTGRRRRRRSTLALALALALGGVGGLAWPVAPASADPAAREISWPDLAAPDWPQRERLARIGIAAREVDDEDADAQALMRELRGILDAAPTVSRFDGEEVRLPGYVVPLEVAAGGLVEFLLVPYFGVCVHIPPPPANQMVRVVSTRPVKGFGMMSAAWVRGRMHVDRHRTEHGVSGYRLQLSDIQAHESPAR